MYTKNKPQKLEYYLEKLQANPESKHNNSGWQVFILIIITLIFGPVGLILGIVWFWKKTDLKTYIREIIFIATLAILILSIYLYYYFLIIK